MTTETDTMGLVLKLLSELEEYKYAASNPERVCCVAGCEKIGQHMGKPRADGSIVRRAYCADHHRERQALKKGLTPRQWENSFHPYRKFRKTYCENVDSRLGFQCTTNIFWEGMLQVDHIDGDPTNNVEENMQTLCACCHAYKGWREGDYKTAGRKTLGVTY